tara:strand:+ start:553 stop:1029 length:477 start_codon:yes stop_codon:yes gene_type:complete
MAIHKLDLNDFQDAEYSLYAIHSEAEDYRLASAINLRLKTRLRRLKKDLDFSTSKNLFFSLFGWEDSDLKSQWNLIKNSCQIELESSGQGLFSNQKEKNFKRISLLKEHASVDYFLKISGGYISEKVTLEQLNKVPQISLVYTIEVNALKSKEYLIIN